MCDLIKKRRIVTICCNGVFRRRVVVCGRVTLMTNRTTRLCLTQTYNVFTSAVEMNSSW